MYTQKSLSPVVALALLLVTVSVAVIGFQSWYNTYSSQLQTEIETGETVAQNVRIERLMTNKLFVHSGSAFNITTLQIRDREGDIICELNQGYDESDMIAYWSFDNTNSTHVLDDSGNGHHGAISGSLTYVSGIEADAGDFNGEDIYLTVAHASALNPPNFSISVWANKRDLVLWDTILMKTTNSTWTDGYGFTFSNDRLRFFVDHYSSGAIQTNVFTSDDWAHYVGVYDGSGVYIYRNTAVTGPGVIADPNVSLGDLYIGRGPGAFFWNGSIDEIRFYNKALTSAEVANLYYFNSQSPSLVEGYNEIPVRGCNLTLGEKYSVFLSGGTKLAQGEFIAG